ncbi:hypothetical protein pneo_cds_171 [Pandoravirus neocaledonia]|uniref:Uncharacterized protein n=1 Tax=Pandoravirus neocaledonia TaxID=2107708 RepID=A0A2U7UBD4_9VIRU|nr:hypothetical protein pneo_cds_171 [Pandoravirus neocaledonia]AVK75778.1 hypothetical protein pneo_cds_171 [Pandoravirus neocaledonia]
MDGACAPASYEDALTFDMQDAIMRRLALIDRRAMLRLMSASTTQRALGWSSPGALKVIGGMLAGDGASTTIADYVRASLALGGHADSQMATLTQMQWLMTAYARFVFSSPRARALLAPLAPESPFSLDRLDLFSGACACVSAENVRDWYVWITNTRSIDSTPSPLSRQWEKAVGGTGHAAPSVQMVIDIVAGRGVEAGCGPGPVRLDGASFMPVVGLDDASLACLVASSGDIQRDITAQDVAAWRVVKPAGSLPQMRCVLGCPEVAAAAKRHLASAVGDNMCERGKLIEAMTPLAFPRFTDIFDTRILFAPTHVDTLLLVAVRSTIVENLLQGANLWP